MESLIILIPVALAMVALGIKLFFWAVDSGQFDDLEGPAHSILFDDDGIAGKVNVEPPPDTEEPLPSESHLKHDQKNTN